MRDASAFWKSFHSSPQMFLWLLLSSPFSYLLSFCSLLPTPPSLPPLRPTEHGAMTCLFNPPKSQCMSWIIYRYLWKHLSLNENLKMTLTLTGVFTLDKKNHHFNEFFFPHLLRLVRGIRLRMIFRFTFKRLWISSQRQTMMVSLQILIYEWY